MGRIYSLVVLLVCVLLSHMPPALAQDRSPFEGVWTGSSKGFFNTSPQEDFEFHITGSQLTGVWRNEHEDIPLRGEVNGFSVTGEFLIKGGADLLMILDPKDDSIFFKVKTLGGSKYRLMRSSKVAAERPKKESSLTAAGVVLAVLGAATGSPVSPLPAYTVKSRGEDAECGGFPLQTVGIAPAGYTCRCTLSEGSSHPDWWAVQPGHPSSLPLRCGPPTSTSMAATTTRPNSQPLPSLGLVEDRGSISPSAVANERENSPVGRHFVPDMKNCLEYAPQDMRSDEIISWFQLRNRCADQVTAHWCDSVGGGDCRPSASAEIAAGSYVSSWYSKKHASGIRHVACPTKVAGKTVYVAKDRDRWNCYVQI